MTAFISFLLVISFIANVSTFRFQNLNKEPVGNSSLPAEQIHSETEEIFSPNTDCNNITHFEYMDGMYWGKSDLVNFTLNMINDKPTVLSNITWKINSSVTYVIYEAKPTFKNLTQNQTGEFTAKERVVIGNAFVETSVDFKWMRIENGQNRSGTASAKGVSDEVLIGLRIDAQDLTPKQTLLSLKPLSEAQLVLTSIDKGITEEDRDNIIRLMNWAQNNGTTLKSAILAYINANFEQKLKLNIEEQNKRTGEHFSYTWTNKAYGPTTLNFTRNPIYYYADAAGISYGYQLLIDGYTKAKCSEPIPNKPDSPNSYKGGQSFTSYTFYLNAVNAAMEKGMLNTQLNPKIWPSFSNITAKSVYQIINNTNQFAPDAPIYGECRADPTKTTVVSTNQDWYMNATATYNCSLNISNKNILNLGVKLFIFMTPYFINGSIYYQPWSDVGIMSQLKIVKGFDVFDKPSLDEMIYRVTNDIRGQELFGSWFPLYLKFGRPYMNSFRYYSLKQNKFYSDNEENIKRS